MELRYHLLDVFTDKPFGGNQLAVFPDPPLDLSADTMQQIAKELNLSETTFVFPPDDPRHDFRVRIFTPAAELPMAGHPTIGTAWLLQHIGAVQSPGRVVFEEGIGPIPVTLEDKAEGGIDKVWMRQMTPRFLDVIDDRRAVAQMLSLDESDLHDGAPIQAMSAGLPFLFVALKSLEAAERARLRHDRWEALLRGGAAEQVFITTAETQFPESSAHSRMFAPGLGISEDPATGSASGPLGVFLRRHGLADSDAMISEQGIEMGRPSFVHIRLERDGERISGVHVGGACVYMGHGALHLG